MTQSAEIAAFELLKRSGYSGSQLDNAKLSPEQARDTIFYATGVRIPAGLIEQEMRRARAQRPRHESDFDVVSDFERDSIGKWSGQQSGVPSAGTTLLYKLIAQRVAR